MAAAAAFGAFDARYEFDAPQHYDFDATSTGSHGSAWFAAQEQASNEDAGASGRTPLREVNSQPAQGAAAGGGQPEPGAKPTRKKNIVTSWSGKPQKKLKAAEGPAEQHAAAPAKEEVGKPAKKSKARALHAAAPKASKASKTAKELKPVKVPLKAKGKTKAATKTRLSKVLQPRRALPTRSTKQLTVPQEVQLHTSKRRHGGKDVDAGRQEPEDGEDAGEGAAPSPFKPLVLRVREFDKTPGRFKRKPDPALPVKPLAITEPKAPPLQTSARVRPSVFKPREQEEEEQMAAMPQFRASTLNPLVLTSSGQIGVPKVDKREATEPKPFHFITDDRADVRTARQERQALAEPRAADTQAAHKEREATEGSKRARKSVAVSMAEPVVPRSPMLLTRLRAREAKAVEEPHHEFHARPLPKFIGIPSAELASVPHVEPPAPTQPDPFKLATEQRGAHHRSAMAARLAAEEEAARRARVPRANGLPLSTDMPLVPPKPEPRPLTVPEPFGLASEARHEEFREKQRRVLEVQEAAKRSEAEFKARPMWRGIPFRVHDSQAGLTVPEDVPLHTSARAAERETFNKAMEDKWKEAEVAAQLAAQEARMRDEEERRQLRKAAVFHARPMPDLSAPPVPNPVALAPKPPTKPQSPRLGRAKRRSAKK